MPEVSVSLLRMEIAIASSRVSKRNKNKHVKCLVRIVTVNTVVIMEHSNILVHIFDTESDKH